VVIPTGLGKTLIALLLAIHRLSKEPTSRIIFLAPTKPLVEQHLQTFKDLTTLDEAQLILMTGSVQAAKRISLYKDATCIFMTPQVLQNDLISNRINLRDVSLLIFDEAHRATGDYSYVFLAKKYFQQAKSPKVLALTASPGKNREKIEEVMQNLGLDAIEIRTEDDPDVKPYIQNVVTVWKEVDLPAELLEILKIMEEMLKTLYDKLHEQELLDSSSASQINRRDLLAAQKQLDYKISQAGQGTDLSRLLYLKKELSNAVRISHMSELIEAQGVPALKAFIEKCINDIQERKAGKSLVELFQTPEMHKVMEMVQKLTDQNIDHPKMNVLMTLVKEQFQTHPESRILIFCHFRDTIDMILENLNKSDLIRAARFVGQQTKGKEKGLRQKQQIELVKQFKSGEYNTLIATSVAEEGLDIAECDVVIFYDIVPSEIRAIQRRGRTGRKREGKVILLKAKGTREEGYFWAEKMREKEMKTVLKNIRQELMPKYAKAAAAMDPGQTSLTNYLQQPSNKTENDNNQIDNSPENLENSLNETEQEFSQDGEGESAPIDQQKETEVPTTPEPIKWNIPIDKLGENDVFMMVDSRETNSPVVRELSLRKVVMEVRPLPVGDYIISERVGIERKAVPDFVSSIKDGRLFDELIRLKNQFALPIIIIEGDLRNIGGVHPAAILGAISSIILNMNIFIYQTPTPIDTAAMLIALAKKEQSDNESKKFAIRFKKIPDDNDRKLEYMIAGIPGINVSRAQDLLEKFETIQAIFNASPEELKETPNIGPVIAKNIYKFSTTKYHGQKP
jgi:Fanconi anemia group M protein